MNSPSRCLTFGFFLVMGALSRYSARERSLSSRRRRGEVLAAAPLQCHFFSISALSPLAHTRSLVPVFLFFLRLCNGFPSGSQDAKCPYLIVQTSSHSPQMLACNSNNNSKKRNISWVFMPWLFLGALYAKVFPLHEL